MLLIVLEQNLLSRVESLNHKITQVTVSGDLSLASGCQGKDELSSLAGTVNAMLTAIQKAKFELLQAQESLRFHAEHDSLTGVFNRRAIRDVLRRELARCRRENQSLGVMLADVDHFKRINDRYGHGAGDAALLTVVQRISSTLRPYDLIGRYGGEEFLVIAPNCDLGLTQRLAERIREAVSSEGVELGNDNVPLTVSVGITLGHRRQRSRVPGHGRRFRHVSGQAQWPQPGGTQHGTAQSGNLGSFFQRSQLVPLLPVCIPRLCNGFCSEFLLHSYNPWRNSRKFGFLRHSTIRSSNS